MIVGGHHEFSATELDKNSYSIPQMMHSDLYLKEE
jgi:hypothetical protein